MTAERNIIDEKSLPPTALQKAVEKVIDTDEDSAILRRLRGSSKQDITVLLSDRMNLDAFFASTKVIIHLETDDEVSKDVRDYLKRTRLQQGMLATPYPASFVEEFRECQALRRRIIESIAITLAQE